MFTEEMLFCVNANAVGKYEPETLLFAGVAGTVFEPEGVPDSVERWRLPPVFKHRASNWNKVMCRDGRYYRVQNAAGESIFKAIEFPELPSDSVILEAEEPVIPEGVPELRGATPEEVEPDGIVYLKDAGE